MNPAISITIATWNRLPLLQRVLDALQNQSAPASCYEVIVCDSASTDGTPEMMRARAARDANLLYVDAPVNALSAKRNAGIRAASAPIVVFLDDDVIPDHGFVEAHLKAHSHSENVVFCGQVRFPPDMVATSNYVRFRDSRHLGPNRADVDDDNLPPYMIVVMNCSFRKSELIERVGPVSEAFVRYGCEDVEFGCRICRAGMRVQYLPEALAWHHEYNGSVELYLRKLYVASRDSVDILYRLAPEMKNLSMHRFLEPAEPSDKLGMRAAKFVAGLLLRRSAARAVQAILTATDSWGWAYCPPLYRYAAAVASMQGRKDHAQAGVPGRSWFD